MHYQTTTPWLNNIVLASVVARSGDHDWFYRAARAGRFFRIANGVYLPSTVWRDLDNDERFRARIHAAAHASRPDIVFSHLSAAALWRLPIVGSWPDRPEVLVGANATGPSRRAFTARQYDIPGQTDVIDGLGVTSLARTLVDVARTRPLTVSVAMLDRGLGARVQSSGPEAARVASDDLERAFREATARRGVWRCREALDLADGRSGSPGESLSRVGMHALGLPAPVLQHEFRDSFGRMIVDFWWPDFALFGEFDGVSKYVRDALRPGETPADVVIREKKREDRIRSLGVRGTRGGGMLPAPSRRSAPSCAGLACASPSG